MNGMLNMSLGGEPGLPVKCPQYLGKGGIQQNFLVYCMLPPVCKVELANGDKEEAYAKVSFRWFSFSCFHTLDIGL